ncbi:MAG: adenosylcobinamide-phosphate synthase CbiB [Halodesulfurarchaeum sp.]
MAPIATLAVGLALLFDTVLGEPPESVHPVAWLGRLIGRLDRPVGRPRIAGFALALLLPVGAAALAALPVWALRDQHWLLGGLTAGIVLFTTVSLDMLTDLTAAVIRATETEPETARQEIRGLVGRDTAPLSPAELRSGAVESLAENLADGLVGPLLAFALGSLLALPIGVGAAAWVKAVNTLDSMVGYPDRVVGTASARLDDLVEWVPARLSAALLAIASGSPGSLARAAAWARDPPSPNSGWPMATLAAALDVRLRKPDAYDLHPRAELPTVESGLEGVRLVERAGVGAFVLAGVIAWF